MSEIRLRLREAPDGPVNGAPLRPDCLRGATEAEIARRSLRVGPDVVEIGELFHVEVRASAGDRRARLSIEGELQRFERLGRGMAAGELRLGGDVGAHLGAGMSGGDITVQGSAGGWCGAEMTGGRIHVEGDVGRRAGAAYPGSPRGMNRGVILVEGNAGPYLGETMRRGLIAVRGQTERHAGAHLVAGSLFLLGGCRGPVGAAMRRGTILTSGDPALLPGFRHACTYRPPFLPFYFRRLRNRYAFPVDERWNSGRYRRYSGDFTELGRGEVLALEV